MRIIGQPLALLKIYKAGRDVISDQFGDEVDDIHPDMLLLKSVYEFGFKHGYRATIDAYGISKSTYYNYCRIYSSSVESHTSYKFKSTRAIA